MGFADSGHYYSYIYDREHQPDPLNQDNQGWYEFNDTIVKYFDPRDISNEAFGGEEKVFIYFFIYLFFYLFIYLYIYFFFYLFIFLFIYIFIFLFIFLFIYLFIFLFIY